MVHGAVVGELAGGSEGGGSECGGSEGGGSGGSATAAGNGRGGGVSGVCVGCVGGGGTFTNVRRGCSFESTALTSPAAGALGRFALGHAEGRGAGALQVAATLLLLLLPLLLPLLLLLLLLLLLPPPPPLLLLPLPRPPRKRPWSSWASEGSGVLGVECALCW